MENKVGNFEHGFIPHEDGGTNEARMRAFIYLKLKDQLTGEDRQMWKEFIAVLDQKDAEKVVLQEGNSRLELHKQDEKAVQREMAERQNLLEKENSTLTARVAVLTKVLEKIIGDGFHCGACNSVELAQAALKPSDETKR